MCSPAAVRESSCSDIGAITLAFRAFVTSFAQTPYKAYREQPGWLYNQVHYKCGQAKL